MVAGMHVAAHAVLGAVERRKAHPGSLVEYVVVVHARRVGDEAHALALEDVEVAVAQHLYAGLHLCSGRDGGRYGYYGQCYTFHSFSILRPKLGSILRKAHTPMVAAQHIMVHTKKWR